MTNVATLSFQTASNRWVAMFQGKILASSPNKDYVVGNIRAGRCTKANAMKVTDVREIDSVIINADTGKVEKAERFSINERFDFLSDFVEMVGDRTNASLIVTGEGGLGKTHTVNKVLRGMGLKNSSDLVGFDTDNHLLETESKKLYTVVKGYSTAKGLFRTLYECRNRIVIFDDCDSILRDATALNILKGALDSYDRRMISWNAESFGESDLPKSFEFKGGVIFISNQQLYKIDQAIRSRSICVDLSMTTSQKIERMGEIIKHDDFMHEYTVQTKQLALSFLDEMQGKTKDLNLRTLMAVTKVAGRKESWRDTAEYLLTAA